MNLNNSNFNNLNNKNNNNNRTLTKGQQILKERHEKEVKDFVVKISVFLFAFVCVLCAAYTYMAPKSAVISSDGTISKRQYKLIENGMTYPEVVDIIGREGTKTISNKTIVLNETYEWKNQNGSRMNVNFQEGKVIAKGQSRLK